jgi:tetratricopeptide (TPR) repeat protein
MLNTAEAITAALQYHQSGNLSQAETLYRQILQQEPEHLKALHCLGLIAHQTEHIEDAIALYQQVVSIDPTYVWVYNDFGTLLRQQGWLEDAIAAYQEAIVLKPDFALAHYNLGNVLQENQQIEAAITAFQQAIALKPDFTEAYYNLGVLLQDQGQLADAIATYQKLLDISPNHVNAHLNLAIALLLTGDFTSGFAEFEWRWQLPEHPSRNFPQPLWDGSDLAGRTILLHAEQGFGDSIQFVRYAPLVAERGGRVILECQAPLVRLLETMNGVEQVIARDTELPEFDLQAPLMSLPFLFQTTLDTVPVQIPYLTAPASPLKLSRSPHAKLHVGIVWAGNPERQGDRDRSCPLHYFYPVLELPEVACYSLQKGAVVSELAQLSNQYPIQDLSEQLHDFADTAAAIQQLDLIITVDTAVAHLAGALGHPVWVVLAHLPDWRWMCDRLDSPWYPGMRLFRQSAPGDWSSVFTQVVKALRDWQN